MNDLVEWLTSEIELARTRVELMKDDPECEMGNVIDMIREMTLKEVLQKINEIQ